jgi:hypothetical protein
MKFTTLITIAVAVLASISASAQTQTYTFGFVSIDGEQYCNYEVLQQYSANSAIWQGQDIIDACDAGVPAGVEGTIAGATASVSEAASPVRIPIKGVAYADSLYDAANYEYTGIQWFVLTALTPSTSKFGWVGFASYEGIIYGAEYGYLTETLPDVKTVQHVFSTGQKAKRAEEHSVKQKQ